MTTLDVTASKDETGENFPVASRLIAPKHRSAILAFYRFARAADDIADSPNLTSEQKVRRLDLFETTLLGQTDAVSVALPLREELAKTAVTSRHALDLLVAFRMDAVKTRYADFEELMRYCRYSAAPVGRFVLDVHGESERMWPTNDALCCALQIINHVQDCGKDFHEIDRVYLPSDMLAHRGADVAMLGEAKASPCLLACIHDLVERNQALVAEGRVLSRQVTDWRLRLETAIIGHLAAKLNAMLLRRDPLCQTVHLSKVGAVWEAALGVTGSLFAGPLDRISSRPRPNHA